MLYSSSTPTSTSAPMEVENGRMPAEISTTLSNQPGTPKKIGPKSLNTIAKKVASNFKKLYKDVKKGGQS